MNNMKRKPFFIRKNFEIAFVVVFISLLLCEISGAVFFIYRLSWQALEDNVFRSHLNIQTAAQIVEPVIIKVNIYVVSITVFLGALALSIILIKRRRLFLKIISGLDNLKDNNASFRLRIYGGKKTRVLLKEFNQAAAFIDRRQRDMDSTFRLLTTEMDLKRLASLHKRLYHIITGKYYY